MKRIISLILALVLCIGLIPLASAASAPVRSSNLDNHRHSRPQLPVDPLLPAAQRHGAAQRAKGMGAAQPQLGGRCGGFRLFVHGYLLLATVLTAKPPSPALSTVDTK